jgi:hypothetical protein
MITKLIAENFKRVKAVTITPAGAGAVVIGGKNDQGKSSGGCDAIEAALGGKDHCPGDPIRTGEKKASIILETDTITVTRTFTPGGTQLKVEGKDGARFPSPQGMLDKLLGELSFDPLAFARKDAKDQAATLRRIVGLTFEAEDVARAKAFAARTEIGREIKRIEGAIAKLPAVPADAPAAEVSVAELAAEFERRSKANQAHDRRRKDLDSLREDGKDQVVVVADLKRQLAEAEKDLADIKARGVVLRAEVDTLKDEDLDEVRAKISGAESVNAAVRAKAQADKLQSELDEQINASEALTKRIDEIDGIKADATAKATYPIPGLSVTDDGVLLDGHPFEQASQSDRIKTSVAIGLALNPKFKVLLVRDGALLDDDKLRLIGEMAAAAGAQVWVEVVGDREACTVIIENGEVR